MYDGRSLGVYRTMTPILGLSQVTQRWIRLAIYRYTFLILRP
jgi:hypothetical protein